MAETKIVTLLAGSFTEGAKRGQGVSVVELDTGRGSLRTLHTTGGVADPSFLAVSPGGSAAYAVSESDDTLSSLSLDAGDAAPRLTGTVETGSAGPCHVAVSPDGRHAVVANYRGGAVSVIELAADGPVQRRTDLVQHRGSGIDADRQAGPHAHSATFDPLGERILVCDLGLDRVLFYRLHGDTGDLEALPELDIPTPAGTGPRHLTFAPAGTHLYVAGELNSTLLTYAYDPRTGETEQLQVTSTLGAAVPAQRNHPADIHVHPSGRFVYVSNRGLDSIAVFAIDERDGRAELLRNVGCGGRNPRNFAIDPGGALLLSANGETDNVAPFWIAPATGLLSPAGDPLPIGTPACLRFLRS